jgi:ABC-type metal ion transport system substrate-binding protein
MNQQNSDAGLHLKAVAGVHIEPMGIYSQKYKSLSELPDGAAIGIPMTLTTEREVSTFLFRRDFWFLRAASDQTRTTTRIHLQTTKRPTLMAT